MDSVRRAQPKNYPPITPVTRPASIQKTPSEIAKPTLQAPAQKTALFTDRRPFLKKYLLRFSLLLFCVLIISIGIFGVRLLGTINTMQLKNQDSPSLLSQVGLLTQAFRDNPDDHLKKTSEGRINILLLGRAGESYPGKNLTDTIMLASIDTEKHKVGLISLPRDLYITLDDERVSAKINSLYQYGLNQNRSTDIVKKAVSEITGEPIHYTFILDFDGFEKIIDSFGGINVEVMRDIYDERYPGKNYSYETFELKKGWQTLDGKTALKYVRERHDDPEGDFGRAKRQQQVISALKEKAFSNSFLYNFDTMLKLMDILGESVKTDATLAEMESFFALSKKVDTQNIETLVIDAWKKESLLRVSHVPLGGVSAFILVPRSGNWQETKEASQSIFSRELIQKRQEELLKEQSSLTIIYPSEKRSQAISIKNLLEEFFGRNIELLSFADYDSWPEQSMLLDRTALQKPWSLDTIMKKLSLEKKDALPIALPETTKSDFLLLLGTSTLELPREEFFEDSLVSDTKEGEPLIIEK
jgi:LCP family protein required for cell wall assembly